MKKFMMFIFVGLLFCTLNSAQADLITGSLWRVDEAIAQNAIPSNVPAGISDVTFGVNSPLNFSSSGSVQQWLDSGSAINIVENTVGTLASPMDDGTGTIGTLVEFTGFVTVTNGQTFGVTHDDGLTLIIGGLDLGFNPGPTAPIFSTATYTGPSGNFPFQLVYGECCGPPAVLQVDLPFSNVPVPGAFMLGSLGLGFATWRLKRRRRA